MQAPKAPLTERLARWRASSHVHHPEGSARLHPTLGTHPESLASALVSSRGICAPPIVVFCDTTHSPSPFGRALSVARDEQSEKVDVYFLGAFSGSQPGGGGGSTNAS
jgi:hypothetical protein